MTFLWRISLFPWQLSPLTALNLAKRLGIPQIVKSRPFKVNLIFSSEIKNLSMFTIYLAYWEGSIRKRGGILGIAGRPKRKISFWHAVRRPLHSTCWRYSCPAANRWPPGVLRKFSFWDRWMARLTLRWLLWYFPVQPKRPFKIPIP